MGNSQESTDDFLIQKYLEGDVSSMVVLVKRYHKEFCEKAYWITKDKELAKDIAQESWIRIMNKVHTLKDLGSFKSWAQRIVYHKSVDAIKLRQKDRTQGDIEKLEILEDPVLKTERQNIHVVLMNAIRKLPIGKQEIIRLFYAEEYSINEISKMLNIPIGTVKSRLFKAREKLKSLLKNRS